MAPPPVPSRMETPHIRLNSNPANILLASPEKPNRPRPWAPPPPPPRVASPHANPFDEPSINEPQSPREYKSSESLSPTSPPIVGASLLQPPRAQSRSRTRTYRDFSPSGSTQSSRRSSLESDMSADSRQGLYDSRTPSRSGSEDELINTQTVSRKFNIAPYAGLIMYPEDVEKDDALHNPDDQDGKDCNIFTKRGLLNVGSLLLLLLGVLTLFVAYPVISWLEREINPAGVACAGNKDCISAKLPLLKNVRKGLVDPTTPSSAHQRTGANGKTQKLVFSDEFSTDNRTFYGGDDAYFQAVDLWYGATQDLEWYDPDAITTKNGNLEIRFDEHKNHGVNYRSGMLQSWNQMCFKGGYMEASISLPGRGDTAGFWPGFWTLGNLARPGYVATSEGLWPYSYHDKCDFGITKNQSDPDGLSGLPGMRLPACTCSNADHPNPGKSRSAPEIDALEASVGVLDPKTGDAIGSASQSVQFAPFDIWYQPNYDFVEVYDDSITSMNAYRGGAFQEALSGLTNLNNTWYDGHAYQKYGFDYVPGAQGEIVWNVGDDTTWKLDARAVGPNGNIGQRVIPEEPLTVVFNFGMSPTFANINFTGLAPLFPATMRIDYIRIYQDGDGYMGCDPPDYPTTEYIAQHPRAYLNREKLKWADTGYEWPKNTLVDGCT